jgi:hypothetical protein
MTVNVVKQSGVYFDTQWNTGRVLASVAEMFSNHPAWDIIDSYSSNLYGRYQGDPIADGQWPLWTVAGNVGDTNSWFIVEAADPQINPTGPKQQIKFQSVERGASYADPSGNEYGPYEGTDATNGGIITRYSPLGGWNPATFDFDADGVDPATQTTTETDSEWSHGGDGNDRRLLLVGDEDTLYIFQQYWEPTQSKAIQRLVIGFGEYVGKSASQVSPNTRMFIGRQNQMAITGGWNGDDDSPFSQNTSSMASCLQFLDKDNVMRGPATVTVPSWNRTGHPDYQWNHPASGPNQYDADPTLDFMPLPFTEWTEGIGHVGEYRLVWHAVSPGRNNWSESRDYLHVSDDASLVFAWDGSTDHRS